MPAALHHQTQVVLAREIHRGDDICRCFSSYSVGTRLPIATPASTHSSG